jgi:hypothetical protein
MKIKNIVSIEYMVNQYELAEVISFGIDRANGKTVTVKLCTSGEVLTVYPEELIVVADSL